MKAEKWAYLGLIVVLVGVIFWMGHCKAPRPNKPGISGVDTLWQFDTLPGDPLPYPVYQDRPVLDTLIQTDTLIQIQGLDSGALKALKDYYSTAIYNDTLKNDTSALIVIREFCRKNRVSSRLVTYQNRRATLVQTGILEPKNEKTRVYLGGMLSSDLQDLDVGPCVMVSRGRWAGSYGVDLIGHRQQVTLYYSLHFGKK